MTHRCLSRPQVHIPKDKEDLTAGSFFFNKGLPSIYICPGRTPFTVSLYTATFSFLFPGCIIEKGKGKGSVCGFWGGRSTECFEGPLLYTLKGLDIPGTRFLVLPWQLQIHLLYGGPWYSLLENIWHYLSGCMDNTAKFHQM